MKTIVLHDCHINFEDDVKDVETYLGNHLNLNEFQTIFNYAHLHQQAYFQDRNGHHYLADYKNGEYFIEKI